MASDSALVDRARQGDVESFGVLARRYERSVLAVALRELRDIHVAEDVTQTTLLLAFRRLETLKDGSRFAGWLMQIARRQVVEAVRARRMPVGVPAHQAADEKCSEAQIPPWIEHEYLLSLVARLPENQRVLIGLRYFDGQSTAEIAAITGRPIGTVTKQLSRAIARLHSWWDKENLR